MKFVNLKKKIVEVLKPKKQQVKISGVSSEASKSTVNSFITTNWERLQWSLEAFSCCFYYKIVDRFFYLGGNWAQALSGKIFFSVFFIQVFMLTDL